MDSEGNKISFECKFLSDENSISNKLKRDVAIILAVEATFTIRINDEIYFQTELSILEFYKCFFKWKEGLTKEYIPEFHYYSIEYDDYEDGAILSMIPFSNLARVTSIWAELEIYNVFQLTYIVKEFVTLEEKLRENIEKYYDINLKKFISHIPYSNSGN